MSKIIIIDYGMGNLRSIANKFRRLNIDATISHNLSEIKTADKLILPGVGHFKTGITRLREMGLINLLNSMVLHDEVPILGICLGLQLFSNYSEEGEIDGLGWIDATTVRFKISDKIMYKVPHMGWNSVEIINKNKLDYDLDKTDMFYFVHSYYINCEDHSIIWMKTKYDYEFVSAVKKGNIYGTQFHPEKSHDSGVKILKNFAEL
jgi:imidazole glycerol-phosphate synthase subunit HisH